MSRIDGPTWLLICGLVGLAACTLTSGLDDITGQTGGADVQPAGGAGGAGAAPAGCLFVSDCPSPANSCEAPICLAEQCGTMARSSGAPMSPAEQIAGDCSLRVCDGTGHGMDENDEADAPVDEDCLRYECNSGHLLETPVDLGESCAAATQYCNGDGSCVQCNAVSDCVNLPDSDECQQRACKAGACVMEFTAPGVELAAQNVGDCKVVVCNGSGGTREDAAVLDEPDDDNVCTIDSCTGSSPVHDDSTTDGNSCPAGDTGQCNNGQCVGCLEASDCGDDTSCMSWSCEATVCHQNYELAGTVLPGSEQTAGNCQELQCDGSGGVVTETDDSDVPADEPNECTTEACVGGSVQFPPQPVNTLCPQSADGRYCDGDGSCVDCNSASQCDVVPDECEQAACNAHQCGLEFVEANTPSAVQAQGDCKVRMCQAGGTVSVDPQPSDLPDDGNECTENVCTGDVPSNPSSGTGEPCDQQGGQVCDGAGSCVSCTDDSHCPSPQHCSSHECIADLGQGAPCDRDTQCTTGVCVDGYCCNTTCKLLCRACSAAKTGQSNGSCADVRNRTDPDNECAGIYLCQDGACCDPEEQIPSQPKSSPNGEPLPLGPCR